jgi:hypothetical protein
MIKVRSTLTHLTGDLLIDVPDNKSGRKVFPEYPVFTNRDTAFVDWDKNYVYGNAYAREAFYYEVAPFTLRSLDYMLPDTLKFNGYLTSGGIFPAIAEPLRIRPDYSLGFSTQTPKEGLPVFGGKGTFIAKIDLSNHGLHGDGQLNYLNSQTHSADFLFLPDSMYTVARNFTAAEQTAGVEYPSVLADSVVEYWLPYRDSMSVRNLSREMAMYNGQSTFTGGLGLTPDGMVGDGTIHIRDAEMDSRNFHFGQHAFDALIANFRIRSYDLATLSISTKNYKTHFDFALRRGEFKSNFGISRIEFPFNQYICTMDRFDWLIDEQKITLMNEMSTGLNQQPALSLAGTIDAQEPGSEFISVNPAQDSLRFFSMRGVYDLKTNVINAEMVSILRVADAAIFPDSGKVTILKDAQMNILHNANLIFSTKNKYHSFYKADISVAARNKYTGKAFYDYVDITGSSQQIYMDQIRVDSTGSSVARGSVSDSAKFMLSPAFAFTGTVTIQAKDSLLAFAGGFRAVTDCLADLPQWVKFKSSINPRNVVLPVSDDPRNLRSERLTVGLVFAGSRGKIYPAFFNPLASHADTVMIAASGVTEFSAAASEFRVAPAAQIAANNFPGPMVALDTRQCRFMGKGKLNLGLASGNLNMEAFGTVNHYILPDSTNVNASLSFSFPFLDAALEKFRLELMSVNLPGVNIFSTPYATAMANILPREEGEKLKNELEQFGKFRKFPDALIRTLVLADVRLRWDSVTRAYVSYGPIGIASLRDQMVNRYVEGKIELARKRNGDDFTLYLQLTPETWYFFNFRNNILQVISSNLEFNDMIIKAQADKSEMSRVEKEAKGFHYTISTERKKRDFLRRFEMEEQ